MDLCKVEGEEGTDVCPELIGKYRDSGSLADGTRVVDLHLGNTYRGDL